MTIYAAQESWRLVGTTRKNWEVVAELNIKGSLQNVATIKLSKPVIIRPNCIRGFYIHSKVNHDRALKYQSYRGYEHVIADDRSIVMFPGQARCGVEPFSEEDQDPGIWGWSWWRSIRGFSGSVTYRAIKKTWSPKTHHEFPPPFRRMVVILLMAWNRHDCVFQTLPLESLYTVIESMEWDWFGTEFGYDYDYDFAAVTGEDSNFDEF